MFLKNKHNFPADNSELAKKACNFKQIYRKKYFLDWKHHILLTDIRNDFKLKSTFFSVTEHTDHVVLNGKGFGHGVGLSQEGAIQMEDSRWHKQGTKRANRLILRMRAGEGT